MVFPGDPVQARAIFSSGRPSVSASAATVKKAGVAMRPVSILRSVSAGTPEAAAKLAALLREEDADLLLSYDPQGQYGHRDHVMVHRVGVRAAQLAGPGARSARPIGDVLQPAAPAQGTVRR